MKRRRRGVTALLCFANLFFRIAKSPMRTVISTGQWQQLEVQSFLALHGVEGFHALAEGTRAVAIEELPGINLTVPLDSARLTPQMAASAGAELRRTHGVYSAWYGAAWSHGDAHAGNFIYDEAGARARMIDFEVTHVRALPAHDRHVDDVFVFLQDIAGRIHVAAWEPCARAFLQAYGEGEITKQAIAKLPPPQGAFERLWWHIRTGFLPVEVLRERFARLAGTE